MDFFSDNDVVSFDSPASKFGNAPIAQKNSQGVSNVFGQKRPAGHVSYPEPKPAAGGCSSSAPAGKSSVFGTLKPKTAQDDEPVVKKPTLEVGGHFNATLVPLVLTGKPESIPQSVKKILEDVKEKKRDLSDIEIGELRGILRMNIEMNKALASAINAKLKEDLPEPCYGKVKDGLDEELAALKKALEVETAPFAYDDSLDSYGVPAGMSNFENGQISQLSLLGNSCFSAMPGGAGQGPFPVLPGAPRRPLAAALAGSGPVLAPAGVPSLFGQRQAAPGLGGPASATGTGEPVLPPARVHFWDLRPIAAVLPNSILAVIGQLSCQPIVSSVMKAKMIRQLRTFIFAGLIRQMNNPFPFVALCCRLLRPEDQAELLNADLEKRLQELAAQLGVNLNEYELMKAGVIPQVLPPMLQHCRHFPKV